MIKILITGGAGNVGGSLASRLVDNDNFFVVIVDNLLTGKKSNLPDESKKNWKFINCDVNDIFQISSVMNTHNFVVLS